MAARRLRGMWLLISSMYNPAWLLGDGPGPVGGNAIDARAAWSQFTQREGMLEHVEREATDNMEFAQRNGRANAAPGDWQQQVVNERVTDTLRDLHQANINDPRIQEVDQLVERKDY